jgi:hypothetical protein
MLRGLHFNYSGNPFYLVEEYNITFLSFQMFFKKIIFFVKKHFLPSGAPRSDNVAAQTPENSRTADIYLSAW